MADDPRREPPPPERRRRQPWWDEPVRILLRVLRGTMLLAEHLALAAVIIFASNLIEDWSERLNHGGPKLLFGRFPISHLFDAFDVLILVVLGFWGLIHFNKALRGT